MNKNLTITNELVEDIPVLLAQMERMGIQPTLDEYFPTHGNWRGISLGWTSVVWLSHILSQGDHRLSHVQDWAEKRLQTLSGCIGQAVRALDFSDDRLGDILLALSDDERWGEFEAALNQHLLRVYDLNPQQVRLDSTSASGHCRITEEGLFQLGHSKDHRPDLPQVKMMLSALDPLGMPVATDVLSGERADDPLYIPAIAQVREGVKQEGLLYVGDCKMAALQTRAFAQAGGDFYLCPLPAVQLPDTELESYLNPVWSGEQSLRPIYRQKINGEAEQIGEGYERAEPLSAVVDGKRIDWIERRLVIRSLQQAKMAEAGLQARMTKAQAALEALNERKPGKPRFRELEPLRQAGEAIVKRHRLEGLLNLSYEEQIKERPLQRYGKRPAGIRVEREVRLHIEVDEEAVNKARRRFGWRVYVTNQPAEQLSLTQAVLAYRNEYLIERAFGRLKGKPLSLTPMYLQNDDHATGLIRLLTIGLRVLTLLEFTVRRRLAAENEKLSGLYAGNPKRSTARPTAESMLRAFKEIALIMITAGKQIQRHLTPLSN
ncbi:transposase, partial [Dehalococcoidia bacterium]|nr:transposase [Dehalococcoidia bacterium]